MEAGSCVFGDAVVVGSTINWKSTVLDTKITNSTVTGFRLIGGALFYASLVSHSEGHCVESFLYRSSILGDFAFQDSTLEDVCLDGGGDVRESTLVRVQGEGGLFCECCHIEGSEAELGHTPLRLGGKLRTLTGCVITGEAQIYAVGGELNLQDCRVGGIARIDAGGRLDDCDTYDQAQVEGDCFIRKSHIYGNATVKGAILLDSEIFGDAEVSGQKDNVGLYMYSKEQKC